MTQLTNQILSLLGKSKVRLNGMQHALQGTWRNSTTDLMTGIAAVDLLPFSKLRQSMIGKTLMTTTAITILTIAAMPLTLLAQIDPRRAMAVTLAASVHGQI